MKYFLAAGSLAIGGLAILAAASGVAEARVRANDRSALAMDRVISPTLSSLTVTSPAAEEGKPMPDLYTAFGKDVSPPISWSDAPPGTLAYAVVMQDADAADYPATHWLIYNIPATDKGLRRDVRNQPLIKATGVTQGLNYAGGVGYIGPHPAVGEKPHHYHLQVFALDRLIKVKPKADLTQVLAGMEGRVLAEGEVVAVYAAPTPDAPKPAAPPKAGDE